MIGEEIGILDITQLYMLTFNNSKEDLRDLSVGIESISTQDCHLKYLLQIKLSLEVGMNGKRVSLHTKNTTKTFIPLKDGGIEIPI